VDCKKCLAKNIIDYLAPIQEKRNYYKNNMDEVKKIVLDGTNKARAKAKETMKLVKEHMKIDYFKE
jgi:tryptophanyl-tRNA synthetase